MSYIHSRRRLPVASAVVTALAMLASLLAFSAAPAHALVGGSPAADTRLERATVGVQSLRASGALGDVWCTGTLIAPDLVVSAGHCYSHGPSDPPPHTPYRDVNPGWGDWEIPGRWYPIYQRPTGIPVRVGPDITSAATANFSTVGIQYTIPNNADVFVLRLADPVPADIAQPVPVLTRSPTPYPRTFWAFQTYTIGGYGGTDQLRLGTAYAGAYPCPRESRGWKFGDNHKICVTNSSGDTVNGDSGGPLYWTDPDSGVRYLVGVFQGEEDSGGQSRGRYTATFHTGVDGFDGGPRPDLRRFFERLVGPSDQAFAWVTSAPTAPVAYAHAPAGQPVSVTRLATGSYTVDLPRPARGSDGGNVQVTAYGSDSRYCKVRSWTAQRVRVGCYNSAGQLADSPFSVASSQRWSDAYAWASRPTTARYTADSTYSHSPVTGQPPEITRTGLGAYAVDFGLGGSAALRNVLVTAYGPGNARCAVRSWSASTARVQCHRPSGSPVDTPFSLLAATGFDQSDDDLFGWGSDPTLPEYAMSSTYSHQPEPGTPQVHRLGVGRYRVTFDIPAATTVPGAGPAPQPRSPVGTNVQVTAYGADGGTCKVVSWGAFLTTAQADVSCHDQAGDPADTRYTVRFLKPSWR